MNWLKTMLLILALAHVILGFYALYTPEAAANMLSLQAMSAGAVGELRAIFGGLIIALGVIILRGSMGGSGGKQWLFAAAVAYLGLAAGRVVSVVLDGIVAHTVFSGLIEGGLAVILAYAAVDIARPAAVASGPSMPPAAETKPRPEPSEKSAPAPKKSGHYGA